ncbi:MAG: tetratricopeptide repeat protein [Deltaproteobacteria bacterium]|nr:tetratricopeptide repeat protein [Deltaproteobacteria bacterium]
MKHNLFLVMIMVLAVLTPYQAKAGQEIDNCFAYTNAGDYQRAIEAGKKAVELYPKDGDANFCLGDAYRSIGQFKLALTYLKEAERFFTSKQYLISIYNKLGLVFSGMGDYDNALFYDNKHLFLTRKLGNRKGEASALNNIALIFEEKGMTDKALGYYEESLNLSDEKDKAATYNNIGSIYYQKG